MYHLTTFIRQYYFRDMRKKSSYHDWIYELQAAYKYKNHHTSTFFVHEYETKNSSIVPVLCGPNLTLELSTFGLLKKTSFFLVVLRPPRKKNLFFSRRPSVKVPKLDSAQRGLVPYYYKLKHF